MGERSLDKASLQVNFGWSRTTAANTLIEILPQRRLDIQNKNQVDVPKGFLLSHFTKKGLANESQRPPGYVFSITQRHPPINGLFIIIRFITEAANNLLSKFIVFNLSDLRQCR